MKLASRVFAIIIIVAACALAQGPAPQFSSDISVTSPRKADQMQGKMFADKGKVRMDMSTQGHNISMITNAAAQTSYMIMHEQHMYMEMHMNTANPMAQRGPKMPDVKQYSENPCASEKNVTCKKVGTETVNGRSCDKWEFTSTTDPKSNRTAWIDQKTHMPIKMVSADGTDVEFTNFKEGPQDPSHFEVPTGYQKLDIGAMMQGHRPGNQ